MRWVFLVMLLGLAAHWFDLRSAAGATRVEVDGLHYERLMFEGSRVHIVTLGLDEYDPLLTRPRDGSLRARSVQDHARRSSSVVAVNASFFHPFHSHHPWDFAPRHDQIATPVGGLLVDGEWVARPDPSWPMLCFAPEGRGHRASITERCAPGARWGVAGAPRLVENGVVTSIESPPAPRTAVGLRAGGDELLLVVVDGRQPHSDGLSWRAVGRLMRREGVREALNLDGGGSSTLVIRDQVLNSPIHTRVPGRQRPVPVHLGFRRR